jgi:two-component system KDP operon response regulator KdpE
MTRILVVDDEAPLRRALSVNLTARGYEVDVAATGEEALQLAAKAPPDLVLLDLGLPGIDGTEVIHGLRGWSSVPVIVLSARGTSNAKVDALDAGADDYVTKPFGIDELLARVRSALRRSHSEPVSPIVETADFTVDLSRTIVTGPAGLEIRLTPVEWLLVDELIRHSGRLVSQRQLLERMWGPSGGSDGSVLRVHFAHIRKKLEPDPSRPRYFITEPGMGYRFQQGDPG